MTLDRAVSIAESCTRQLRPFCRRIEVAGSIRRKRRYVKDIEIVAIPGTVTRKINLFEEGEVRDPGFIEVVNAWQKVKGDPEGKYTQRRLRDGTTLDLFMATPENWGYIFALRTGSGEFSHEVLGKGWVRAGYKSVEGMLTKDGQPVAVREEADLFRLIGMGFVEPERREVPIPPRLNGYRKYSPERIKELKINYNCLLAELKQVLESGVDPDRFKGVAIRRMELRVLRRMIGEER